MITNDLTFKSFLKAAILVAAILLLGADASFAQQTVNLTAAPTTYTGPDGTTVPMWSYFCGTAVTGSTAACAAANPNQLTPASVTPVAWVASHAYISVGSVILDSNGNVQVVTTAGTSGATAPAWGTTAGATTTDGTVVWTFDGSLANYLVTATSWSPVVITVPTGQGLTVNLTNNLSFPAGTGTNTIPTSIVIVGQVGGGLGGAPTTTPSPDHSLAQGCPTWFIASGATPPGVPCSAQQAGASNTPPIQGPRVQSMATEVAAGATTTLTWPVLKPGTYLLESGTHPSIQVPMGLIGMLVVTTAPSGTTAGTAYPSSATAAPVPYNAEVPAEFSEIDPVQNKEVDRAVRTAGFSETAVWSAMTNGAVTAINVGNGGSGYTSTTPPIVTITGGSGPGGATATATVGALVSGITVTGATSCVAPTIAITDSTGSGAQATATVSGGLITGVTVTNPGSLYTSPTVTVTDPGVATCSSPTVTAAASLSGSYGAVYAVNVTSGGGYSAPPNVLIASPGGTGTTATATAAISVSCGGAGVHTCYPPAVNYTPFYYLINGVAFNKTAPANSVFAATAGTTTTGITGTVLVRMVNAGLHMHTPSIVGSLTNGYPGSGASTTPQGFTQGPVQGFSLIAEDGNVLPNVAPLGAATVPAAPRVQTDVLMVPSKVFDVLVNVPAAGATATPALPIYDRELSLSANSSARDAGMLAYISVNNSTPSAALPVATGSGIFAAAQANADTYGGVTPCAAAATSCISLVVSDVSKGVIANDVNVNGVQLSAAPANGALTCNAQAGNPVPGICANGTFTYTPNAGANATAAAGSTFDTFTYYANGNPALTATVTLNVSSLTGPPVANSITYTSKMATFIKIPSPGVLSVDSDPNGLPLHVVVSSVVPTGVTVNMDPAGGFTASVPAAGTYTFTYAAQNSQGRQSAAATVTLVFPAPSNLKVNVLDAKLYNNCNGNSACISTLTPLTDYRWIIEEDETFWVDPNCTTASSISTPGCPTVAGGAGTTGSTIPTFGVNFHTSAMNFIAQGCTGPLSCEYGQTMLDNNPSSATFGTHINAVCDAGNGACRPDTGDGITSGGFTWVNPSQVALDPTKRYYISVLPGDAANPFPAYVGQPVCSTTGGNSTTGQCGHTMSGAPVPPACNILLTGSGCTPTATTFAFAPVNVLVLPTPLPTGKLTVMVFEDDYPLNGEQDGGGGGGTVAPLEPGLGGFNIVLWDTYGGLGDVTGQDSNDAFNQPLTNSLSGTKDPATGLDACPISASPVTAGAATAPAAGITGMIVTCPKYESDGTTLSPLAGQAVIANLMQDKFSVQAYPGADRIARGEQWVQTNTLDGQHPHDSFIRLGEPSYFQEYGPAGYHVAIGFANPAIINARTKDVCAGNGSPGAIPGTPGSNCNNTITGQVDVQRLSRTPDQRLYPSGSRAGFAWSQCWVSLGDPDAEDFMFTFCDADGNFKFTSVPNGNWRLTIGDQWNDQIIDGLSTPANVGCTSTGCTGGQTLALGNLGVQQWQSNLLTTTFIDDNKNGIRDAGEIGIPLIYAMIHYRDGHTANNLVTDFNGVANFNETFPLFNWYVVEADSGRYKTTGIHTVYDAGGPADGSPSCAPPASRPCGSSPAYTFLSNTNESVPLQADLSVPGAVYCAAADCANEAASFAAGTAIKSSSSASTGRIDPPWVWAEGWSGLTSGSNWIDFGKAPYASCPPACVTTTTGSTTTTTTWGENGGIHGLVVYAATRPFDSASWMIQQPWAPNVPRVTINLYQEGFAADGVTPTLKMVDTTQTTSWDDWAQGFYPGAAAGGTGATAGSLPYMSCPGQGTATGSNADLFFFSLFDQPNYLDWYHSVHDGGTLHALPYNSQYKCYDAMHIGNQLQPAPYDGRYFFPSVLGINPATGKLVSTVGSTNGVTASMAGTNCTICVGNPDSTDTYRVGTPMLPPGKYVVQVIMPPGYEVYKEEDKNLLIGDNYIAPVTQQFAGLGGAIFIIPDQASVASMYDPSAAGYNPNNFQNQTTALGLNEELSGVPGFPGFQDPLWPCVGELRTVPDYLSLFPQAKEAGPFAGAIRPLCDRKEVTLPNQMSVSAKFYIFTSTHIAAKFTGVITDDFTSEFDPFSPQFGEKFAPANLSVSTRDYLGNEISRVYSDHWGVYDGLNFSSWEVNPPNITGYSPSMMVQCMNDPGPIKDSNPSSPTFGQMISDPLFNPAYSNFCYEEPYMPGLTAYLDTPVVPTTAFVGAGYNNVDCAYPDTTPAIKEVDTQDGVGPWMSAFGHTITITSLGVVQVNNSAYSGPSARVAPFNLKTVPRNYGFGNTAGTVTVGGVALSGVTWSNTTITGTLNQPSSGVTVPSCTIQQQAQYGGSAAWCGQLVITAANGKQSIDTVTVTIGGKAPTHVAANQSVQAAIDAAAPGDLIIIDPTCTTTGTTTTCSVASHQEMLIMWKPVRLQGVGGASSVISANAQPAGKLLDPWRRHLNCFFGLTLQGVPYTAAGGTAPYDPAGVYSCPDASNGPLNYFTAQPNNPQVDRLPLEAVIGWDASQNGNLAEQLQEPSLMGAFEGAGVTVLAKGVDYHGANPWNDGFETGGFPLVTTLLTGVGPDPTALPVGDTNPLCTDGASGVNRFPSNFTCNPSSIDGLTITNSSQGGGGIFAHGWAHHLQVANNRVYNNAGTLTGGISVGQGEFAGPYIKGDTTNAAPGSCSDGTGFVNNQHLPYCLQMDVNVHNNYVTTNSSLGDELFSGTLSGGGGVTFCTGNDYYKFNFNWVCGNLSSGEGGGLVHLGEIQNGDIEHNSFLFNQSQNPTIPTNGGAIQVMGTPDTDPTCGTQIDADCPPGLSDGIGHNLKINANLIQGNMSESGSGGGIRLQQVNGTDVSTFPGIYNITAATEAPVVTIRIPGGAANVLPAVGDSVTIAGNSVAGYNGTFTVTRVGGCPGGLRCFQFLGTTPGLTTGTGGTFTDAAVRTPQPGGNIATATDTAPGTVTITSTLSPTVGDSVTITGFTGAFTIYNGTHTVTSVPSVGTFTYLGGTGLYPPFTASATATTFPHVTDSAANQAVTNLWNSVSITNNIIVNNVAGWDGAGISLQDSLNVAIINNTIAHNDALASSGVLTQSVGNPVASAPAGNCTNGTGTTSCPQSAGVTSTLNSSLLTTTFTGLTIRCPFGEPSTGTGSCRGFSNPLLMNNLINQNRSFRVGVGTLGTGNLNQQNIVTLLPTLAQTSTGSCAAGASYWDIGVRGDSGPGNHNSGFTITNNGAQHNSINDTNQRFVSQYCDGSRVPPECTVADGCGGPSGYGVPPGIVDASTPNPVFSLTPSATVDEGNNWINVSWGPLSVTDPSIQGPTVGGTPGNYGGGLALGNYTLLQDSTLIDAITYPETVPAGATVPTTDFFGNPRPDTASPNRVDYGAVEFQHTPGALTATLISISPNSGVRGTTVNVTLTGTNLTSTSAVNVSGTGIIVSGVGVQSDTTVVATFTIAANATVGNRNVTVVTAVGTTNAVTFTVIAPGWTISPTSGVHGTTVPVTITGIGTNFVATGVTMSGTGITCTVTGTPTATNVNASCVIAPTASRSARTVTLRNSTGSVAVNNTFQVTGATLMFSAPSPALTTGTANTTTKTGTITVTNGANGDTAGAFTFTAPPSITKNGTAGGTFSITGGTCASGTVLNPGTGAPNSNGTCSIIVQYAPGTSTATTSAFVTATGTGLTTSNQSSSNFNGN